MCCWLIEYNRPWGNIPSTQSWMLQAWGSLSPRQRFGSLLSGIFLLTKPPGLLIIPHIAVMSSSDRLARVCGESFPWSFASFWSTVWLKPSLKYISSISLMMVGGRLFAASACLPSITVTASSSSFSSLAPFGGSLSYSASGSSPSECMGTSWPSCLPSPPCDKLARFVLLVSLDLISATSFVKGGQAVVSLATQAALTKG